MIVDITPPEQPLVGTVVPPGDKSVSHRALIFAAMASGTSKVSGVLDSADVRSTASVLEALGATIVLDEQPDGSLSGQVTGWGEAGPTASGEPLDCGNSGTTARLMLGVLAGWPIKATLTGDISLSARPMGRVTEPLTEMGASFESDSGTLPITVHGGDLTGIAYSTPVASAQIKSAILIAGLRAQGQTSVTEPAHSRDHTERMLPGFSVNVDVNSDTRAASVTGPTQPTATDVVVPGDPSSAAFLIGAALLVPGSDITVAGFALNPTRTGFLKVLERMGAQIEVAAAQGTSGIEEMGDARVRYTPELVSTEVTPEEVPSLIDEIPLLALVAARAAGETRFEAVGELRVKESDRLSAIIDGVRELGAKARSEGDTLIVTGTPEWNDAELESLGDHRLAMTWAVAGLATPGGVNVWDFEAVEVSYPGFLTDIESLKP